MYFEDGAIVRTQNWDNPSRYDDSAFDTFAFGLSYFYNKKQYHPLINHKEFFTDKGTVREEKSQWREDDMSEDNEMLIYVFCRETYNTKEMNFIWEHCRDFKTGNGGIITPAYWAELFNWKWLRCLTQLVQAIFFLFPYWNDGNFREWKETIETLIEMPWKEKWAQRKNIFYRLAYYWPICSPSDRTDGYLKWAIIAKNTYWPFRKLIAREKLKQKILAYYWREIESQKDIATTVGIIQEHWSLVDSL